MRLHGPGIYFCILLVSASMVFASKADSMNRSQWGGIQVDLQHKHGKWILAGR